MAAAAGGAQLAGAGLQAYGQYEASKAQAAAAEMQALFKDQQVVEMGQRMRIQEKSSILEGEAFKANQLGAFAASGVSLSSGATLLALEDSNNKILLEIDNMKRETQYRMNQLSFEAQQDRKGAGQIRKAGTIQAAGTLLGGAGSYYSKTTQ